MKFFFLISIFPIFATAGNLCKPEKVLQLIKGQVFVSGPYDMKHDASSDAQGRSHIVCRATGVSLDCEGIYLESYGRCAKGKIGELKKENLKIENAAYSCPWSSDFAKVHKVEINPNAGYIELKHTTSYGTVSDYFWVEDLKGGKVFARKEKPVNSSSSCP